MKRYFFFDIDGTLTSPLTACVPEETKEAIRQLQAKGNFVALATGRLQCDAYHIAQQLGIRSVVSDGGNGLTIDGQLIYHRSLPLDACYAFLDDLDDSQYPWAITIDNKMEKHSRDSRYMDRTGDSYYRNIIQADFDYRTSSQIFKMFVDCPKEEEGQIEFHGLRHVRFKRDILLIEPTAKENGIFEILKREQASDDSVVVFGDGMNDCSMFRPEWFSVAMGNANPLLKAKASYVTDDVDKKGLSNALRRFGWID
mgnify:CR=1 FL=1